MDYNVIVTTLQEIGQVLLALLYLDLALTGVYYLYVGGIAQAGREFIAVYRDLEIFKAKRHWHISWWIAATLTVIAPGLNWLAVCILRRRYITHELRIGKQHPF